MINKKQQFLVYDCNRSTLNLSSAAWPGMTSAQTTDAKNSIYIIWQQDQDYILTGTLTGGSSIITNLVGSGVNSITRLTSGMYVQLLSGSSNNIPVITKITSVNTSNNTVTIDSPVSGTGSTSNVTIKFLSTGGARYWTPPWRGTNSTISAILPNSICHVWSNSKTTGAIYNGPFSNTNTITVKIDSQGAIPSVGDEVYCLTLTETQQSLGKITSLTVQDSVNKIVQLVLSRSIPVTVPATVLNTEAPIVFYTPYSIPGLVELLDYCPDSDSDSDLTPTPTPTGTLAPTKTPTPTGTLAPTPTPTPTFVPPVVQCNDIVSGFGPLLPTPTPTTSPTPTCPAVYPILILDMIKNTNYDAAQFSGSGDVGSNIEWKFSTGSGTLPLNQIGVAAGYTEVFGALTSKAVIQSVQTRLIIKLTQYDSNGTIVPGKDKVVIYNQLIGGRVNPPTSPRTVNATSGQIGAGSTPWKVDSEYIFDQQTLMSIVDTPVDGQTYYILPEYYISSCNGTSNGRRMGDTDGDGLLCSDIPSLGSPHVCGMAKIVYQSQTPTPTPTPTAAATLAPTPTPTKTPTPTPTAAFNTLLTTSNTTGSSDSCTLVNGQSNCAEGTVSFLKPLYSAASSGISTTRQVASRPTCTIEYNSKTPPDIPNPDNDRVMYINMGNTVTIDGVVFGGMLAKLSYNTAQYNSSDVFKITITATTPEWTASGNPTSGSWTGHFDSTTVSSNGIILYCPLTNTYSPFTWADATEFRTKNCPGTPS